MKNREVARMFRQMADVLEFQGELIFKVNSYRKASRALLELERDLEEIWQAGEIHTIPGIGAALAKKVEEYLRTGRMRKYDEILAQIPAGLVELMEMPNLGPKTVALLHKELRVNSRSDLLRVIKSGQLNSLPGFGEKKIQKILAGLKDR